MIVEEIPTLNPGNRRYSVEVTARELDEPGLRAIVLAQVSYLLRQQKASDKLLALYVLAKALEELR